MSVEAPAASSAALSSQGFERATALFENVSGIKLSPAKHSLVVMRLAKLATEAGERDLDRYVQRLADGEFGTTELTRLVDRLTTNETYFFREPEHFRHFGDELQRDRARPWRVWSGASSSGEEIYSLAMLMADRLGLENARWQIVGTDLSTAMVDAARRALYPARRAEGVPPAYLKRYCLRGQGRYEGMVRVDQRLRERTCFETLNLMQPLPEGFGPFDAIWLRNVLIYFDNAAKAQIVGRVIDALAPGGLLYTGHAESLIGLNLPIHSVAPAVYARD
ncbi:MAG: SAM-dependent methyltransferase [Rubrivivax sp.]|nr:SAM-dependent methyltransferase [Rubrivivax sp.]